MQVVIHVSGYYDWEPTPADVEVTKADIDAKRVKPAQGGGWLMRVDKKADTHTTIAIPENELFEMIVGEMTRGDRVPLTRLQAAHRYISRHHLDHHTHKKWMQEIEVADHGGSEDDLRTFLKVHVDCGNISEHDVEDLVAAYLQPSSADHHVDHLHKAFGVKPERIAKRRSKK